MSSDPYTDLDHAFQLNPDTDPIRTQCFDDQYWNKKIQQKFFIYLFLIKNCNFLISKLQKKCSALEKIIQHFKKWNLITFLYFCGSFCPPGSLDPIESGSNPDPIRIRNRIYSIGSVKRLANAKEWRCSTSRISQWEVAFTCGDNHVIHLRTLGSWAWLQLQLRNGHA
jgi:hypothetical protein